MNMTLFWNFNILYVNIVQNLFNTLDIKDGTVDTCINTHPVLF